MSTEPWERTENPSRYDDYNWYSDAVPARKFYLFIAEIGRRLQHLMTEPGPIRMIDLCEQCAEGQITEDELRDLSDEHRPVSPDQPYSAKVADTLYFWVADRYKVYTRSFYYAADVFAFLAAVEAGLLSLQAQYYEEVQPVHGHPIFTSAQEGTKQEWGAIVRDIYGPNPFRQAVLDPHWLSSDVMQIARGIYEELAFDHLPILADALEEAGCTASDLLSHLRGPGPHVRGCWALDLILGRE